MPIRLGTPLLIETSMTYAAGAPDPLCTCTAQTGVQSESTNPNLFMPDFNVSMGEELSPLTSFHSKFRQEPSPGVRKRIVEVSISQMRGKTTYAEVVLRGNVDAVCVVTDGENRACKI